MQARANHIPSINIQCRNLDDKLHNCVKMGNIWKMD